MDARTARPFDYKDPSIGSTLEIEMAGVTVIVCVLLIAACFAAPLLL